jgi:hypothetical protein
VNLSRIKNRVRMHRMRAIANAINDDARRRKVLPRRHDSAHSVGLGARNRPCIPLDARQEKAQGRPPESLAIATTTRAFPGLSGFDVAAVKKLRPRRLLIRRTGGIVFHRLEAWVDQQIAGPEERMLRRQFC